MSSFHAFTSLARRVTGTRPGIRPVLAAAAVGLVALGLAVALGFAMPPPTNRPLADALATGG